MTDSRGAIRNDHYVRFERELDDMSAEKMIRYRQIISEEIVLRCLKTLSLTELKQLWKTINERLEA